MRRDTQIGIILGVVILVVIGIFLSTRTTVNETKTPDLKLSEENVVESEIEEIDMNELIEDTKATIAKKNTPTEEVQSSKELVENTPVEPSKDNVTLEGKWEGTKTASIGPEEAFSEVSVAETITEEPEIAKLIPPKAEESIVVLETKQADVSGKVIHKVKPNDSLFKISRKYYGDEAKWHKIYEANKGEMSDPDALYVGQELLIPEITLAKKVTLSMETPLKKNQDNETSIKTTKHTVVSGDTLYRLARKYYDDSTMWYKIYEANEDSIEDKSLLIKGQILIIPE
ncbi:MAG: LysM peptidoglycan-binding domain-containing protein [Candidatus Scalindua sp.]